MNKLETLHFELEREKDFLKEMQSVVDTPRPFLDGENSKFILRGKKEFINRKKVKDQKQVITNLENQISNVEKETKTV